MSEGMTNFLENNVDLSGYFPAYEVLQQQIVMTNNVPSQFELTFTLTRNKNNVTNYIVLSQPKIISTNFNIYTLGTLIRQAGIYNKTSTTFSATILITTTSPALSVTADFWFVVIYPYTLIQPIVTSLNYFDTAGNPTSVFPQYMTSSLSIPNNITNITLNLSLSDKATTRTDYYMFASFYDSVSQTSGINATRMQQAYYYLLSETNTSRQVMLVNTNLVSNIILETLVLYASTTTDYTNDYTSVYNVKIGDTFYNLAQLFPLCEFFKSNQINNDASDIPITVNLKQNSTNTTNYAVLSGFTYNSDGVGDTYNIWEAINGGGNILIDNITSTSFRATFDKSTGQKWNGYIIFLIIYY